MTNEEIATLSNQMVNEVAGHLPYNFPAEYVLLIRRCAKYGFDEVIRPRLKAIADLKAHLKEAAEREAELARLRDENDKLHSRIADGGELNERLREGLERLRQQSENKSEAIVTLLAALKEIVTYDTATVGDGGKGDLTDSEAFDAVADIARAAMAEVERPVREGFFVTDKNGNDEFVPHQAEVEGEK